MNYYISNFPLTKTSPAINSFCLLILQIITVNVPGEGRSGQAAIFVRGVYRLGDAVLGDIPPGMMLCSKQQEDCGVENASLQEGVGPYLCYELV